MMDAFSNGIPRNVGDAENGHCIKDPSAIQQQNGSSHQCQHQRRHSLLSSLFSSPSSPTSSSLYSDEQDDSEKVARTPSPDKPRGFFSSVWNRNYGLLSELSSKFEAALHVGLDSESDSGSLDGTKSSSLFRKDAGMKHSSKHQGSNSNFQKHSKKQFSRATIAPKDRSVYGQPEVEASGSSTKWYSKKEYSCDSLDTVDSGQSVGYNSMSTEQQQTPPGKQDPFYVFRHNDSLGIGSESDTCGPSTSLDSSDAESVPGGSCRGLEASGRSGSGESLASTYSCDSQMDESSAEVMEFMKNFVRKIFKNSSSITLEEKSKFGEYARQELGRLWFARCVNAQRVHSKRVNESTFYSLVQYFAIVLFECSEADDFSPAKSIMNMCFTFYLEACKGENQTPQKEYLYIYLKSQPIWRSLRFWNAAFFDAVQCERARRPMPTRSEVSAYSPDDVQDEMSFQENITFGQLGTFTYNMHSFGLSKEFCLEFLRKQCTIANLRKDQVSLLRENIERMYQQESL